MASADVDPGEALVGEGVARLRNLAPGKLLFLVSPAGKLLKLRVKGQIDQRRRWCRPIWC